MGRHSKKPTRKPDLVIAGTILAGAWVALTNSVSVAQDNSAYVRGPLLDDSDHATLARATKVYHKPPEPLGQKAVDLAMGKLGVPYVWGAKGPSQFDCSGLTGWVWRQLGVPLGPDTYTQIHQGKRVSDVMPGDLIFPSEHHVQLAVSKTEVIEAPGRGMVVRLHPMPSSYTAIRVQ